MVKPKILDEYVKTVPSNQNAVNIFGGEWASAFSSLPDGDNITSGVADLFNDERIVWLIKQTGGIKGYNILELGPLEGGHSYMLEKAGAKSIIAIDANTRSFLKCLITKEIFNLKKSKFMLGDFCEYFNYLDSDKKFDLILASGVIYHMKNPIKLISDIGKHTDKVFIWTHYYCPEIINNCENIKLKFGNFIKLEAEGFSCDVCRYEYQEALSYTGFCGGSDSYSYWMKKDDMIMCLKYFGFKNIIIGSDHHNHPNGPAFTLLCTK